MANKTFAEFAMICNRVAEGLQPTVMKTINDVADYAVTQIKNDAPVDTGFLKNNVTKEKVGTDIVKVISKADYSVFVDKGHRTRSGSMVEPNPFFSRTIDEIKGGLLAQKLRQDLSTFLRSNFR